MSEKTHHTSEKKKQIAKNIQELILDYPIIAAVDMENLPAPQLQQMRSQLRGKIELTMTKRRVMKHAIEGIKDKKRNIEQLIPYLKGMPALIFTKENPFSLFKTLKKSKTSAPAKAGQTAPFDVMVPKGPTSFAPGPVIGELAQLGIKSGVEGGKVVIKEDSIIVKEGKKISAKAAEILTRLGIKPMEAGLNVTAVYENEEIFTKDILDIDEEKFVADMQKATLWAFNLAFNSAYTTRETIDFLIGKAFNDAKALGLSQNIIDDGIIEELVSKAEKSALSLKTTANIEIIEKPKEKKEEPTEKIILEKKEEAPEKKLKKEVKKDEEIIEKLERIEEKKEEKVEELKKEEEKVEKELEKIEKKEEKIKKEIKEKEKAAEHIEEEKKKVEEDKKIKEEGLKLAETQGAEETKKKEEERRKTEFLAKEEEEKLEKQKEEEPKPIEKEEEKILEEEKEIMEEEEKLEKEVKEPKIEASVEEEVEEEVKEEEEIQLEKERIEKEVEFEKVEEEKPTDEIDKKIAEMVAKTKKFVKGEIPSAEKLIEEASKLTAKELRKEKPKEKVPTIQELKERKDTEKKKKELKEVEDLTEELVRKGTLRK